LRLLRSGDSGSACAFLQEALRRQPDHPGARRNLIRALLAEGRYAEALPLAEKALQCAPEAAEFHFARGTALNALGQPGAARGSLEQAIALSPSHAPSWLNLANALMDMDELEAAEAHCLTALRLDPSLAETYASLGYLRTIQGRLSDAMASCEAAIRLRPMFAHAHWNLATAALLAGDLPRGFREYEWRKRHDRFRRDFVDLPGPVWDGSDPAGQTILVHAEQGFGDTIQFARFLRLLVQRSARVILSCDPGLVSLLGTMPGVSAVSKAGPQPRYDAWIDQMSLPHAFGTTLETIPAADGYLAADPIKVAAWKQRLPAGRLVGMTWSGNAAHSNDRRRSIPAQAWESLLARSDFSFVNLGLEAGPPGVLNFGSHLTNYAETAALIANLDLVISVDTSVVHLAGALGRPAWVLLPHAPDWRWLLDREDTPWYRSVRLFRQAERGDWVGVLAKVAAALTELDRADRGR
jgi:Flp pilus assembly protein TadD